MRPREIEGFCAWLDSQPHTAISEDRLWSRELDKISPMEIQLFYARAGIAHKLTQAREAIENLQSEMLVMAMEGKLQGNDLRIIAHEVPEDRFTTNEFVDRLVKLSKTRRMATLFGLTTKTEPKAIEDLGWRDVRGYTQLPSLAGEILSQRKKLRHLRLDYVFWEWLDERMAGPLFDLQRTIEDAFGESWPVIQRRWDEMIWVDGRADASSFLAVTDDVASGRL